MTTAISTDVKFSLAALIDKSIISRDVAGLAETLANVSMSRKVRRNLQRKLRIETMAGTVFDVQDMFKYREAWKKDDDDMFLPSIALTPVKARIVRFSTEVSTGPRSPHFYSYDLRGSYDRVLVPKPFTSSRESWYVAETPVPFIPKKHMPFWNSKKHFILFDVPKWRSKTLIPEDPYILKRLSENKFKVISHWDLTENEKRLMQFAAL